MEGLMHLLKPDWKRIDATNYDTEKAREDSLEHRRPAVGALGCHPRAVLEGTPWGDARREDAIEPLRSELYRRWGADAAEGNPSAGWGVGCGGMPESVDRRGDCKERERYQEPQPEGPREGTAHRFLRCAAQPFDRRVKCARAIWCENADAAGGCTKRGTAADAGPGGSASA